MAEERRPHRRRVDGYVKMLSKSCGMETLLDVYQSAYDRYTAAEK